MPISKLTIKPVNDIYVNDITCKLIFADFTLTYCLLCVPNILAANMMPK